MLIFGRDPQVNPFSKWLESYGIYVAIGAAAIVLIIVVVLVVLSLIKKNQ